MNLKKTFNKKVAIVTGGAGGIGSEISIQLAKANFHVIITYLTSKDNALKLEQEIRNQGGSASAYFLDISKMLDVKNMFEYLIDTYERIDVIINNAGTMIPSLLIDLSEDLINNIINVNLIGCINMLNQSSIHLNDFGVIINISSTVVEECNVYSGLYAASKSAIEKLGKVAAKELGKRGIRVNSIRIGPTIPGMFSKAPKERQMALINQSPFNRLGSPKDVANLILYLISDEGKWINRQVITSDGGLF
ncbi:SDR family oxidoreductase [Apibacter sp. B2966]|uniref:SDR family oxidoreductase n=1 Tax=Apibacter sp. B2966 TaxID=2656761 RepID=UPI0014081F97|nr:SDR family oxidoreductase [Apibacter sp. B2966]QII72331.1 SDR family oxidoreductase [Apibacter sp. B2966]